MANELNIVLDSVNDTGLTVSAKVRQAGGTQVGSTIAMTEVGSGFYTGDFSLVAVSDGVYSVEFIDDGDGSLLGDGQLQVKGNLEYSLPDINDFNSATDTVAQVTLVGTTTTNTDMRGTDGANTTVPNTIAPDNASITSILADTNELQLSQGDWATATTTISSNMRGTDGANTVVPNTVAPDNAGITANGVAIGSLNNFNPTLDTVANVTLVATTTSNTDMVSIAGLSTFDNGVDEVITDSASRTASKATGFTVVGDLATLATETNATANKDAIVAEGGASWITATGFNTVVPTNLTAVEVRDEMLTVKDDFKATTTISSNMRGTDSAITSLSPVTDAISIQTVGLKGISDKDLSEVYANTSGGGTTPQSVWEYATRSLNVAVETDVASRDASKADVSLVATQASLDALNDFNPTTDVVANVALVAVTTTNTDQRGTDGGAKPSHIAPLY